MKLNKFSFFRLAALLILAASLSNCSLIPPADPRGQLLFRDDFSNKSSGWKRSISDDLTMDYIDGAFTFQIRQPAVEAWSTPGLQLYDVDIEVDAAHTGSARGTMFGLICRYQNPDNYYFFLISDDGYAAIGSNVQGERQLLSHPTMLPFESIHTGSSTNHLEAVCAAESLRFSVNGSLLAEVQDTRFKGGDVGLIVISSDEPGGEIRFSSFGVHSP